MPRIRCGALRAAMASLVVVAGVNAAQAAPVSILFVGNSYTFGRVDPVMSYNTANVRDLTDPARGGTFANLTGSNDFEPHPWGGVPGIFKMMTVQAGLDYDVALSTRNAATLRGHYLNLNPAGWDLRGNIASQRWDKVVLQERSDGALPLGTTPNAFPEVFRTYATFLAEFARTQTADRVYREREFIGGGGPTNTAANAACSAASGITPGSCGTQRTIPGNPNANPDAEVYLYETWARQNLITGGLVTTTDDTTGEVTRTGATITGPYPAADGLEHMTQDLTTAYFGLAASRPDLFAGVAPVGQAFLRAVQEGIATRNMYAPDALTDGLIDLWFDDGTHASKHGSYLSALTLFGTITGLDPRSLGSGERAAADLGITAEEAVLLQSIAAGALGLPVAVPEPGALALLLFGVAMLGLIGHGAVRRRAPLPEGAAGA